jgi:dihydrofolate synthase / folylpolyglutamate synthase
MKFGLRNIRALLKSVDNPEKTFPSIHVAGTNGKGSTACFLASIGMEAGYKTGLYTSPHLVRFTERIRINGHEISQRRLVQYTRRLRTAIESVHATFFEATTCIAFMYFSDERVELAVIEVGLGGRLDATNVIKPLVSVITNIGLDHTQVLGSSIFSIAKEKAGIIKRGIPCVTSSTDAKVLRTLRRVSRAKGSMFHEARKLVSVQALNTRRNVQFADISAKKFTIRKARIGLAGKHQVSNARLAVASIEILLENPVHSQRFRRIDRDAIVRGLKQVPQNTGLRGRLETIRNKKRYVLDVAHNPAAMQTLRSCLDTRRYRNLIVVFGVMKDKDYVQMMREIGRLATVVVPVVPSTSRAVSGNTLYRELCRLEIAAKHGGSVRRGLKVADAISGRRDCILITGSHYVVGEAIECLSKELDKLV